MLITKYKIYCVTDNQWEYVWSTIAPTVCPINAAHTINPDSVISDRQKRSKIITPVCSPIRISDEFLICDTTLGNITILLPPAAISVNGVIHLQKSSSLSQIILTPFGSDLIDGSPTQIVTQLNDLVILKSDGIQWHNLNIIDDSNAEYGLIERNIVDILLPFAHETGDLVVFDGSIKTPLPIGQDNQVLTVDKSEKICMKWAYPQGCTGATGEIGPIGATGEIGPTGPAGTCSSDMQDFFRTKVANDTNLNIGLGGLTQVITWDPTNTENTDTSLYTFANNDTVTIQETGNYLISLHCIVSAGLITLGDVRIEISNTSLFMERSIVASSAEAFDFCLPVHLTAGTMLQVVIIIGGLLSASATINEQSWWSITQLEGCKGSTGPTGPFGMSSIEYYTVSDEKSSGTHGGTATSGSWEIRTLSTIVKNPPTSSNVLLASDEITILPGQYLVTISAPAYNVTNHQIRLYDVTNDTIHTYGTSELLSANHQTRSFLTVTLDVILTTVYRIEHRVASTQLNNGYGFATGFGGNERYTEVSIIRTS